MSRSVFVMAILLCITLNSASALAAGSSPIPLATAAISTDPSLAEPAIEALRASGPTGLASLLKTYRRDVALAIEGKASDSAQWDRIHHAIDRVGAQKDCHVSRLYWFTDLDAALAEARKTGKPVLSLHLLGRLDEDLSCANSRFFRAILYANHSTSGYLREHFVLHWQSERPAPVITIDFGDGRKIERTITGNSIHYILNSNGRVVDALPGLYGPSTFVDRLEKAEKLCTALGTADDQRAASLIAAYHQNQLFERTAEWSATIDALRARGGVAIVDTPKTVALPSRSGEAQAEPSDAAVSLPALGVGHRPNAGQAAPLAITKRAIEIGMLEQLDLSTDPRFRSADDPIWTSIAAKPEWACSLDESSIRLIAAQNHFLPPATEQGNLVMEFRLSDMIWKLQTLVARDTVRNEFVLRQYIHQYFVSAGSNTSLASLDRWVYDNLFLTPASDPWLGLYDPTTFTGIDGAGIVESAK